MIKPSSLKKGDHIAIVSLSSGMLGEDYCRHYIELGKKRLQQIGLNAVFMPNALKGVNYLKDNPAARFADLKRAFLDDEIKGIFCAIGGEDTFKLAPHFFDDKEFLTAVKNKPKLFSGFSDTTINHLMFYKIGLQTFYGPNYINDFSEMALDMLPYTKSYIENYYFDKDICAIKSADTWYEERSDFSSTALNSNRIAHKEQHGFELLQGNARFTGRLLGGCLESLYELLKGERYPAEADINKKYQIFPNLKQWQGKIMFLETSEERPSPARLYQMLSTFKELQLFDNLAGLIVGKPQNEVYYEDYKAIYKEVIDDNTPILYNVNFGHAYPRTILAYGAKVKVDAIKGEIAYCEKLFA